LNEEKNKSQKPSGMSRMLQLAGTKKALIVPSAIMSALASVASFVPYLCIYFIIVEITEVYPHFDAEHSAAIIRWGWIAFGGVAANVVLYFGALILSHLAAFGTLYELKINFTSYLARLPLGFHLNYGSGKLRKITDENIEKIEGFIAHQLPDLIAALVAPIVMIVILFMVDWRFGLVSLVGIVIAFVVEMIGYSGAQAKTMMNKYQSALEDMNNASVEYVRGITVVKAFRQTVYSFNRLHKSIKNYTGFVIPYTLSWENIMSLYTTIVNNIYLFLIPAAIFIGMRTPQENYGVFASTAIFYLLFVPSISSVMMKVMYSATNCMQIGSCVDRMDEVLGKEPLPEPEHPKAARGGEVVFHHVSFSYDEKQEVKALDEVSFTAAKESVTAVVGPSGGGKSTIAHLIPRFYDVTEGSISIGGIDIRELKIEDLMSVVSFVFQDVFLFKQSLKDNIRLGSPEATDEEVIAAAKAAQCHEFISALPNGYDTVYGRDGIYLSGGEQQRVAIARAIVKNAPVLVLDEATAFSDPENEHLIQKALHALMADKTVIMIAHRLSTIRSADNILVMNEGKLIEQGTHEELLGKNGKYRAMWDTYTQALSWKMTKEVEANA
jgi:ATP-binding cassette subfamily B protein IrtA